MEGLEEGGGLLGGGGLLWGGGGKERVGGENYVVFVFILHLFFCLYGRKCFLLN